jgi:hypothetical protein
MSEIATIDVTITDFKPFYGPGAQLPPSQSTGTMKLRLAEVPKGKGKDALPLVTQDTADNLIIHGDVVLQFVFAQRTDESPPYATYYPLGIGCRLKADTQFGGMPADLSSLPREDVVLGEAPAPGGPPVPHLRLHNTWTRVPAQGSNQTVGWKYFILFQDNEGNVGAIDPDIENDANPA